MKEPIVSLIIALLLFAGCSVNVPPEASSAEALTEIESNIEEPEENGIMESPGEPVLAYHEYTEKYYDYFWKHCYIGILISEEEKEGFSDMEMAAYALSALIAKDPAGYDYTVGFPKEEMDALIQKNFGTAITSYETRMTKVIPETGNITSTGWGGSWVFMVLKELQVDLDDIYTGTFYMVPFHMEMSYSPSVRDNLLRGRFDDLSVFLVTIIFEEEIDANGEIYLRYHNAKLEGEAKPPYVTYQG